MPSPAPRSRLFVFLALAACGTWLDLASKDWIFGKWWGVQMPGGEPEWILEGLFGWQLSLNEGALFGIGQGKSWLFASLSVLAAGGILFWLFWMGAARSWWLTIALGLVTSGIFGNLYDRLGMHQLTWINGWAQVYGHAVDEPVYAVRDWILLTYQGHKWPNFNIADSFLVCGAAMLFVYSFTGHAAAKPKEQDGKETEKGKSDSTG